VHIARGMLFSKFFEGVMIHWPRFF
jgi:hypothetical protein